MSTANRLTDAQQAVANAVTNNEAELRRLAGGYIGVEERQAVDEILERLDRWKVATNEFLSNPEYPDKES